MLESHINLTKMKTILFSTIFIMTILLSGFSQSQNSTGFYDLKAKTIDGKEFSFSELKGKKVLIVNTASKCGYTAQYSDLQKLYETYGGDRFIIIGFPANNFMNQEPGSNEEIQNFCSVNYGVTFPMMEKISVKGDDMDPVYKWLTQKSLNGVMDSEVKWNFNKFMIDEKGNLAGYEPSGTKPMSDKIVNWIKGVN
jgi:glutathione peroxidase